MQQKTSVGRSLHVSLVSCCGFSLLIIIFTLKVVCWRLCGRLRSIPQTVNQPCSASSHPRPSSLYYFSSPPAFLSFSLQFVPFVRPSVRLFARVVHLKVCFASCSSAAAALQTWPSLCEDQPPLFYASTVFVHVSYLSFIFYHFIFLRFLSGG